MNGDTVTLTASGDEAGRGFEVLVNVEQARSQHVVSGVRIATNGYHAHITVFNRGGNSGSLTVNHTDRRLIASRLLLINYHDFPLEEGITTAGLLRP